MAACGAPAPGLFAAAERAHVTDSGARHRGELSLDQPHADHADGGPV